jgi:hypothetical protein
VLEKTASATLKQDGIRVTLPLSAAAGSGVLVTAWLVAPNDARSGERSVAIQPGDRTVAPRTGCIEISCCLNPVSLEAQKLLPQMLWLTLKLDAQPRLCLHHNHQ